MSQSDDHSTAIVPASQRDLAASAEGDAEDALIGATLHDTYSVLRFMAEGGMGRVYEAQHTRISTKRFAIKVLHADLKHSMDVRLRFRREAEAAASIDHPNVLGVHDFGYTPDGRPYLVSDYLEGHELGELLAKGPLSIALSTSIARQLCRALEAAHERGVIHRDIKPANVFLVGPPGDPEVRVLDFGLSKIMELADASVTQTGTIMGTPSYMSPEQAQGERADHRVDVYGVGAVLYACLTGKPPFEEETPQQTVLAVMTRDPVRPCVLVPTTPPELEVVVQRAMARNPADRYATMKDLESALVPFASAGSPLGASPLGTGRVSTRQTLVSDPRRSQLLGDGTEARGVRRRATLWLALASVLLLVGALSAALGTFEVLSHSRRLLPSELLLISMAVLGSLFTPGILFVLWLRRSYWSNSARMVDLVAAVRGPVLTGASVYGALALLGRVMDVASRYLPERAPAPNASGWLGWAPVLFGVASFAALGAIARHWIVGRSTSLVRRIVGGPLLVGLVMVISVALLLGGYRTSLRESERLAALRASPDSRPAAAAASSSAPASASAPPPSASPNGSSEPQGPAVPIDHAPREELEKALAGGVEGLTTLQSKYPNDPAVLEPLALELGKEPGRASELLRVLDTLFAEAPEKASDPELGKLVHAAVLAPVTSQRAIELMRSRMGLRGAEMLFDLVLNQPELRQRAHVALETAEVQRNLSPALKIAYDLQTAATCSAREDLLPQAIKDGDERAIAILSLGTMKTLHGCGPKRNKPCPALCAKEVPAFESAIKDIRERLARPSP